MLRHIDYTRDRIRQLIGQIQDHIYTERQRVTDLRVVGPTQRISFAQAQELREFRPAAIGERFGPAWATHWFRARALKFLEAGSNHASICFGIHNPKPRSGSTAKARKA